MDYLFNNYYHTQILLLLKGGNILFDVNYITSSNCIAYRVMRTTIQYKCISGINYSAERVVSL